MDFLRVKDVAQFITGLNAREGIFCFAPLPLSFYYCLAPQMAHFI